MKKNYNYTRRRLFLPEYGRHIQEMVDSLQEIEDRTERTRQAKAVIAVMGNLNPLLRDTADFTHKLWDHLFIMSDFRLDVDSPYPLPTRQDLLVRPRAMRYPQCNIAMKHYGKYVGRLLKRIGEESDKAHTTVEVQNIARFMRNKSIEYNQDMANPEIIAKDIERLSDYTVSAEGLNFNQPRKEHKNHFTPHGSQQNKGGNNSRRPQQRNNRPNNRKERNNNSGQRRFTQK